MVSKYILSFGQAMYFIVSQSSKWQFSETFHIKSITTTTTRAIIISTLFSGDFDLVE